MRTLAYWPEKVPLCDFSGAISCPLPLDQSFHSLTGEPSHFAIMCRLNSLSYTAS